METIAEIPGSLGLYCWDDLYVLIWESTPTSEGAHALLNALNAHTRQGLRPDCSVALIITKDAHLIPDGEARRILGAIKERYPIKFMAVVIEHQGFVASAVRAVITSLTMFVMRHETVRMMRSLEEAASWLSTVHVRPAGPLRSEDVCRVLEELRRRGSGDARIRG